MDMSHVQIRQLLLNVNLNGSMKYTLEEFFEYAMMDVYVLKQLIDNSGVVTLAIDMAKQLRCGIKTIFSQTNANCCLDSICQTSIDNGYLLKYKMVYNENRKQIEGAFNYHTLTSEVYGNVIKFDFKGLYPSIIDSLNLSPETILGFVECKCQQDVCSCNASYISNNFEDLSITPRNFVVETADEYLVSVQDIKLALKGVVRVSKIPGVQPEIVRGYARGKDEAEESGDTVRRSTFKRFANTTYGLNAQTDGRLYNQMSAVIITCAARCLTQLMRWYIRSNATGINQDPVIFCNTDSVFLCTDKVHPDVCYENGVYSHQLLQDNLNKFCRSFVSRTTLALEGIVYRMIVPALVKNRYASIDYPVELDVQYVSALRTQQLEGIFAVDKIDAFISKHVSDKNLQIKNIAIHKKPSQMQKIIKATIFLKLNNPEYFGDQTADKIIELVMQQINNIVEERSLSKLSQFVQSYRRVSKMQVIQVISEKYKKIYDDLDEDEFQIIKLLSSQKSISQSQAPIKVLEENPSLWNVIDVVHMLKPLTTSFNQMFRTVEMQQ